MIGFLRYCFALLLVVSLHTSCGKGGCNVIPNVTFNTNINQAQNIDALAAGGYVYASGGVRGLIIYNTGSGLIAYDRCSTVNPDKQNQVKIEGAYSVVDEASGAKWLLMDGSPTHIAECALRRYNVTKSGSNYYVRN